MNISGPAAVAKPEMLFYAPGDLTVTNFFVIPLYRADGCSGTVSLIAVVIHAWHQEKAT